MKRKIALLACFILAIVVSAPVISIVSATKPERTSLMLEKRVFIHYKRENAKPPWAGGGKPGEDSGQYKLLANGAKWRNTPITYVIDPSNSDLEETFVFSAIVAAAEEWDDHTNTELFVFSAIVYDASWDDDAPDGRNELLWGDYPEE